MSEKNKATTWKDFLAYVYTASVLLALVLWVKGHLPF